MWIIRIRWRAIMQLAVCSWHGHVRDQYRQLHAAWFSNDYFCRRCLLRRPAQRTVRIPDEQGSFTMWTEDLDWDGNVLARRWMAGARIPTRGGTL